MGFALSMASSALEKIYNSEFSIYLQLGSIFQYKYDVSTGTECIGKLKTIRTAYIVLYVFVNNFITLKKIFLRSFLDKAHSMTCIFF